MGIKGLVKQVLTEQQNRRYRKLLSDKCVTYEAWVAAREWANWGQGHRGGQTPCPGSDPLGDYITFCFGEGKFAKDAENNIRRYFRENPQVQVLYGDEDVWDGKGSRRSPWFKPDWSPDLFDSKFYFGSLVAVRMELWDEFEKELKKSERMTESEDDRECMDSEGSKSQKGFGTAKADKSADKATGERKYMEMVRQCVKFAGGYEKGCKSIGHFPGILYHVKDEAEWDNVRDVSAEHAGDEQLQFPLLSVIIPSKDNPKVLGKCVDACLTMDYPRLEIIVVDNGSSAENRTQIEEMLSQAAGTEQDNVSGQRDACHVAENGNIQYIYHPMEFNFSKMCNMGAQAAQGELLLLLNDDVELCRPDSLRRMAAKARRSYTGAVGMKLYYPDSQRIQHAGITNLPMGPVHKLQFKEDNMRYYFGANQGCSNFLAVTAACLMVEKRKYEEVGGFCEEMRVAFNDVDFCFSLYEAGYANVCVNDCFAYHYESLSRGEDEATDKLERLLAEREKLYGRHPGLVGVDPYYSPYLNRKGLDTSIRPGYETGTEAAQLVWRRNGALVQGNEPAMAKGSDMAPAKKGGGDASVVDFNPENYRQDNCLLLRVEDARNRRMIGYAVVLGDNNACYEKTLLLKEAFEQASQPASEAHAQNINSEVMDGNTGAEKIFAILLAGDYRSDLAENMADQVNVALCGFDVELAADVLPKGKYRVGMAARNRVTGLRLINWSNRFVEL